MDQHQWTAADLGRQDGRTFIVTGANSGIGFVSARALAQAGARVVLAVRDLESGKRAAASIAGLTEVRRLDLADMASVRTFAEAWDGPLDVLVNDAGVMATPERRSKDGFELQLGTNYLGHFALTNLLLSRIRDRVVSVASLAERSAHLRLDDLNWRRRPYRRWGAYAQSKRAILLFTFELQRRLREAGSRVEAVAAHPGYAATNLQSHTESRLLQTVMAVSNRLFAQRATMGALPILYAATQAIPGGSYLGPDGPMQQRGYPTLVRPSRGAQDAEVARRLWTISEALTHTRFPLAPTRGGSGR